MARLMAERAGLVSIFTSSPKDAFGLFLPDDTPPAEYRAINDCVGPARGYHFTQAQQRIRVGAGVDQ